MPSDPSQGKDSGRKEGSCLKSFHAISWFQGDGCKPHFWPPGLLVIHSVFPQPFGLSCSGLAIKQHICMNQQLSHCHYSSLGHRKNLFSASLCNLCKIQQQISSPCPKGYTSVAVSTSTLIFTWTLLIYKPWWLSLRWPYFVQIGAYAICKQSNKNPIIMY